MAIEITGSQFTPKTVKRFVQKQFEGQGLDFSGKDPEISKRLVREAGSTLVHVTFFLKSGLKLRLGIKFDIKDGKILPKSKGLIYSVKIGTSEIPLSMKRGRDHDWTTWIKKIAESVKKKEETVETKPPSVSKARATDNKIPNTFKAKLEAKKGAREEKKKELALQDKLLDEENQANLALETEITSLESA